MVTMDEWPRTKVVDDCSNVLFSRVCLFTITVCFKYFNNPLESTLVFDFCAILGRICVSVLNIIIYTRY